MLGVRDRQLRRPAALTRLMDLRRHSTLLRSGPRPPAALSPAMASRTRWLLYWRRGQWIDACRRTRRCNPHTRCRSRRSPSSSTCWWASNIGMARRAGRHGRVKETFTRSVRDHRFRCDAVLASRGLVEGATPAVAASSRASERARQTGTRTTSSRSSCTTTSRIVSASSPPRRRRSPVQPGRRLGHRPEPARPTIRILPATVQARQE